MHDWWMLHTKTHYVTSQLNGHHMCNTSFNYQYVSGTYASLISLMQCAVFFFTSANYVHCVLGET